MSANNTFSFAPIGLRAANSTMIARYGPWLDYMLTVTFNDAAAYSPQSEEHVHTQLRHMRCTLNSATWKNRTQFNDKCKIIFIPIIEGARDDKRIHAHILLGNVKDRMHVIQYVQNYIPRSNWLAPRFDLTSIYDADGVAWYTAKETAFKNIDAVAWELASIPRPLLPR